MLKRFIIDIALCWALVLSFIIAVLPAHAADALVITSDSLTARRAAHMAVFEGSVKARRDDMVLSAERMTAYYGEGGKLLSLKAEGSVKLVKGLQVLTSGLALYDVAGKTMTFTGTPRAIDQGNVLIGERIVYFLETDKIKVLQSTVFIESPPDGGGNE